MTFFGPRLIALPCAPVANLVVFVQLELRLATKPLGQQTHRRSLDHSHFRQLSASEPLDLDVQVDRKIRVPAQLEKIIVYGNILGFQQLLPDPQQLGVPSGGRWKRLGAIGSSRLNLVARHGTRMTHAHLYSPLPDDGIILRLGVACSNLLQSITTREFQQPLPLRFFGARAVHARVPASGADDPVTNLEPNRVRFALWVGSSARDVGQRLAYKKKRWRIRLGAYAVLKP
jgi:hypothetical protein